VGTFINPDIGMPPEQVAQLRTSLGLDVPAPVRYVRWLGKVLHGNLVHRYANGDKVADIVWFRMKNTLLLLGTALTIGIIVGTSVGVYTSSHQYSASDFPLTELSFVGISMPASIAGIFGLHIFSVKLHTLPIGGMRPVTGYSPGDLLCHLILPASILSLT
jgi:peptide/nickel transport system permease protein